MLTPEEEDRLHAELAMRRTPTATPQQSAAAAQLAAAYPWMRGSAVHVAATNGLTADHPVSEALAELSAKWESDRGTRWRQVGEQVYAQTLRDKAIAEGRSVGWLGDITAGVKTAGRGLFTLFEGAFHEAVSRPLQAFAMSAPDTPWADNPVGTGQTFAEAYRDIGPSPLVRAVERFAEDPSQTLKMWRGSEQFLGTGLFSGGEIRAEHIADLPVIGTNRRTGAPITTSPGRLWATGWVEVGTRPHSLLSGLYDASLSIAADPSTIALKGIGKAGRAAGGLAEAGLVDGWRKTTKPQRAVQWWTSPKNRDVQRLRRWLADTDDYDTIRLTLKLEDRRLALALRDAKTVDEVDAVVVPNLGVSNALRRKPPTGAITRGLEVRRRIHDFRILNDTPTSIVTATNLDEALTNIDRWMVNSKIPAPRRSAYNARVAEIADDDPLAATKLRAVVHDVMADTEGILVANGVKRADARRITQTSADFDAAVRAYWVDAIGGHADFPGAKWKTTVDGTPIEPMATPHAITEYLQRFVHLPDHRVVRRKAAFYASALDIPGVRQMHTMLDTALEAAEKGQGVWKVGQLATRGAYTVRIMGEAQVRMAAAGLDSFANHPFSAIAWLVANSEDKARRLAAALDPAQAGKYQRRAERLGKIARGSTAGDEIIGFSEDFTASLNRGASGWLDSKPRLPGWVFTGDFVQTAHPRVGGDSADFLRGAAENFLRLTNDPLAVRVAYGGLLPGDRTPNPGAGGIDAVKDWFWSGTGRKFRTQLAELEGGTRAALLSDRGFADATVDAMLRRIEQLTGGNADLRRAMAAGSLGKLNLRGVEIGVGRKLESALADYIDALPDHVSASRTIAAGNQSGRWNRGVETLFHYLNTKPDNYLNRSSAHRQFRWQRLEELVAWADKPTQAAIINAARAANLDSSAIRRMTTAARKPGDRLTSFDDANLIARSYATDATKKLLYDVHRRGQFFDVFRLLFPFGDAFKEVITAWSKLAVTHPEIVRRGQQAIQGGRGVVFHPDPTTGEEYFLYPMPIGSALIGSGQARVEFTGRVEGLNLVSGSILPGVGPAVQLAAAGVVPDTPDWDWARENVLYPFGEPDTSEGVVEGLAPAWMRKLRIAWQESPDRQRQYVTIVGDVMRALVTNGSHSTNTEEDVARLVADAKKAGRRLMTIQGVAQAIVPTGPSVRFTTEDVEGGVWPTVLLGGAYRDLLEAHGGDEVAALADFIAYFGVEDVAWLQGKSVEVKKRALTPSGAKWERAHPEQVAAFPDVVGYFAPYSENEPLDFAAFRRQFEQGARVTLTPEQQIRMSNDFLGRVAYENAQRQVAGRSDKAATLWLREVKAHLRSQYPGYDSVRDTIPGRLPPEKVVAELERALGDPVLAATDAGRGLALYMDKRRMAAEAAAGIEVSGKPLVWPTGSARARHLRDWLRQIGPAVVDEHPDFAPLWTDVFSRELEEDDESLPAVGTG